MGNPTSYLRKTLTWEGKQLTQLSMTIAGANVSLNYDYDENGLRMQKQYSVFGATNTMSYYYNGSVLIGMETEQGAIMRFSYDAGGNVGSVDYSDDYGDTFTTYYYLRNAQGDIVKLIDGTTLPVDGVFVLRPAVAPGMLVKGLELTEADIVVDRRMATNKPGVFAAGDCTGRPYQLTKAVGEGNIAAHSIVEYLAD